jgi:hypothetical protein
VNWKCDPAFLVVSCNSSKETIWHCIGGYLDNTKMDLQEVGGVCGDWLEFARDRYRWRAFVSTVRNVWVPKMGGIS